MTAASATLMIHRMLTRQDPGSTRTSSGAIPPGDRNRGQSARLVAAFGTAPVGQEEQAGVAFGDCCLAQAAAVMGTCADFAAGVAVRPEQADDRLDADRC